MKNSIRYNIASFLLGVVLTLAVLLILTRSGCGNSGSTFDKNNVEQALADTIRYYQDKDSILHAQIDVLSGASIKDFLQLITQDSVIEYLQQQVKRRDKALKKAGSSVTVFETVTEIDTIIKTITTPGDTIVLGDVVHVYAKYNANFDYGEWGSAFISVSQDSAYLSQVINHKYTVLLGTEKRGKWPFKKHTPFVDVSNENPFSNTKTLRAYQVTDKQRKKRIGVGIQAGYGYIINSDTKLSDPGIFIGVGLSYNILQL